MATPTEFQGGRHEILIRILQTVDATGIKGIPRTLIMYRLSISDYQLKEHLSFLVEKGLVEKFPLQSYRISNGNQSIYKITKKGLHFMHISQIESLI
ncbi:MAG: hypothetical protein M3297_04895 [Thermoproteota archaeon]|jgi:predicted transcriptional regulator|nr:hypothetical protein [Thermoproteota archaeon]